ncbi:glycerate kinase [Microlunatus endophyticus]|uniref:Glycerate kinase n=1 Tax=Microlunatus endophyticus TaxID=1716077 RepID=A0A917W0D3_9ACTN|nr:glycerate kinase [Microlunatus endophyticus]GGL51584.1 glycerate kinase [Microlunatus endophyticus]
MPEPTVRGTSDTVTADQRHRPLTVAIAPDSFKGTVTATDAADLIAEGWRQVRDHDRLLAIPLADGGEGTVDAVAAARPDGVRHRVDELHGPDGRAVSASWLELGAGTAVIEIASVCGLPLMESLDPLGATTYGLGQLISAALDAGCRTVIVGAGGSATTDGGSGALAALGLELLDDHGRPVPPGGGGLARLATIAGTARRPEKLIMLSDVDAPLLGPTGAAAVFGPQKGADPGQIGILDANLARFAGLLGGSTDDPGMGAAGGLGHGLVTGLGAVITPGAPYLAELAGLPAALTEADLVISGEGRFDQTSLGGKVVGYVLERAAAYGVDAAIIAGQVAHRIESVPAIGLADLAGSTEAALADPVHWLRQAGARAAQLWSSAG